MFIKDREIFKIILKIINIFRISRDNLIIKPYSSFNVQNELILYDRILIWRLITFSIQS